MHILFFFLGEGVREEIFQTARGLRFGSQITRRTTDTSVIPHGTGPLAVSVGHRTRAATKHNVLPQSTTSDFENDCFPPVVRRYSEGGRRGFESRAPSPASEEERGSF